MSRTEEKGHRWNSLRTLAPNTKRTNNIITSPRRNSSARSLTLSNEEKHRKTKKDKDKDKEKEKEKKPGSPRLGGSLLAKFARARLAKSKNKGSGNAPANIEESPNTQTKSASPPNSQLSTSYSSSSLQRKRGRAHSSSFGSMPDAEVLKLPIIHQRSDWVKKNRRSSLTMSQRVEGRRSWRFSLPEQLYNRVGEDKRILFPWGTSDADPNELLKLGRKLDDSSLGAVYKATAKETGFVVAVKIMPLQSQAMREEIVHEVNGLERARHPNVVRYYGSLIAEDSIWIVAEYCSLGSLASMLKQGIQFTEQQVVAVMTSLLHGLSYLHTMGIYHLNLKCSNILMNELGDAKIADFGLRYQLDRTLEKAKSFSGTPLFLSPEVLAGENYDAAADIWSLGITAIQLVDGLPPYATENPLRAVYLIGNQSPPTVKDPSKWSQAFLDFIKACLCRDPLGRPTARELLRHEFINSQDSKLNEEIISDLLQEYQNVRSRKAAIIAAKEEKRKVQLQVLQELVKSPGSDRTEYSSDTGSSSDYTSAASVSKKPDIVVSEQIQSDQGMNGPSPTLPPAEAAVPSNDPMLEEPNESKVHPLRKEVSFREFVLPAQRKPRDSLDEMGVGVRRKTTSGEHSEGRKGSTLRSNQSAIEMQLAEIKRELASLRCELGVPDEKRAVRTDHQSNGKATHIDGTCLNGVADASEVELYLGMPLLQVINELCAWKRRCQALEAQTRQAQQLPKMPSSQLLQQQQAPLPYAQRATFQFGDGEVETEAEGLTSEEDQESVDDLSSHPSDSEDDYLSSDIDDEEDEEAGPVPADLGVREQALQGAPPTPSMSLKLEEPSLLLQQHLREKYRLFSAAPASTPQSPAPRFASGGPLCPSLPMSWHTPSPPSTHGYSSAPSLGSLQAGATSPTFPTSPSSSSSSSTSTSSASGSMGMQAGPLSASGKDRKYLTAPTLPTSPTITRRDKAKRASLS